MTRPILLWPDEVLTAPVKRVEAFGPELADLLEEMARAMVEVKGLGISAPQLGVSLAVSLGVDRRRERFQFVDLVNLEVKPAPGAQRRVVREGCLSTPGLWHRVPRWPRVEATWCDRTGRISRETVGGEFAQVLQHEFDHVQGRLLVQRLPEARQEAVRRRMQALQERSTP